MSLHLDHLVIAGTDLGAIVAWWTTHTGVAPTRGGSHTGYGTRNALVGAGPSTYVELIGPDPGQPEPDLPRPFGIDELEPFSIRLVTFALPVPDLELACARVRAAGIEPGRIRPMERQTADGSTLRWRVAFPESPGLAGVMPFLIEWGAGASHPASVLRAAVEVERLELGHPRPGPILAALENLGSELTVQETGEPVLSADFAFAGGVLRL